MFALGLLFIIYSVLNVYSFSDTDSASPNDKSDFDLNDPSTMTPKTSTAFSNDDVSMAASTLETLLSTSTKGTTFMFTWIKWPNEIWNRIEWKRLRNKI